MFGQNHVKNGFEATGASFLARTSSMLIEALSPTRCAGCERPGVLICPSCLEQLFLIDPQLCCTACGAPFGSLVCTECFNTPESSGRVLATAVFEDPLARIIRAYKDGGERRLATLMAQMLLDTALHAQSCAPQRYEGLLDAADAITFIPVTSRAFARRGFDHMELVATAFANEAGMPLRDTLLKHGAADQRRLNRQGRAHAAQGVYEVVDEVQGRRLVVLDDVITTGATIRAARDALLAAGAECVDAVALARVW